MSLPAIAIPLIGYGMNAITKALFPVKSGAVDPAQYKNQLTYSNRDINNIYGTTMQDIARRAASGLNLGISRINQAGAAGRLPTGAVMSNIAGAQYNMARGVSEGASQLRPSLLNMQRRSILDYYNLANRYSMAEAQARNQNIAGWRGDIGNLTKLAMLWKAGYFGSPGEPQQPNVPLQGETEYMPWEV